MQKMKKVLSFVLALLMLVGVFTPMKSYAADEVAVPTGTLQAKKLQENKPERTTINIFKLKADSYKKEAPWLHTGGTIEDVKTLGTNVEPLAGVRFTVYKMNGSEDGAYTKADYEQLDNMLKDRNSYATTTQVEDVKNSSSQSYFTIVSASSENGLDTTSNAKNQTKATDKAGKTTVSLKDGIYWIIESDRPSDVTSSIAVPFGITLPLTNSVDVGDIKAGTQYLKEVNVYPKNLVKKDKIDKAFGNVEDKSNLDSKKLKAWQDTYGPKVDEYNRDKATIDARIGSEVPFQSVTVLNKGKKFKDISWSDMMTDGLEYVNKSLKITAKFTNAEGREDQTEEVTEQLKITEQGTYGFDVENNNENDEFIKKLNGWLEKGDVTITFDYKAKVTKLNVVDNPESNTILFTPNKPNHNEKYEGPVDGNIKVEKTWAEDEVPTNILVTYNLIEKDINNKKVVATVTLKSKTSGDEAIQSKSLNKDMTVTVNGDYKVTFGGLDKDKTYTVEEFAEGYKPEYLTKTEQGQINIKNNVNPGSITPIPPQVVTGGKKFVKVDLQDTNKRLAGAEFVVRRLKAERTDEYEYLVIKANETALTENQAYKTAQENYTKAIDKANQLLNKGIKAKESGTEEEKELFKLQGADTVEGSIKALEKTRNEAFEKLNYSYSWGELKDAYKFISNADGQFEVTGLAYGAYELEETKAPAGYAKLTDAIKFDINENSYKTDDVNINYLGTEGANNAKMVENRSLTIPQTGGIGTVIFTVGGLALMGGATFALKRNKDEEEE